ncbi:MAG: 6-bladed beta-propeller [Candidatus Thiodiazotropha lotti]|uniref:6-bladed beta-propeller n=1 Tax=Candidatus Thiodiazotropha lotti TaxID=2792787 RepID=A0A9E4K310_9GAMM|nr:6-bladed beta-propeller [Candidatus Thiodiazotropha lotti]MCG7937785.1 6-bladed beta-propeller [Candidatus Thiodiazotropha lotti]MCG7988796.1 6-bladed beta-propeller [Candidatus Thiodiazotropha lotti]MCG8013994.1 6-bladed beta-propeller [Candidatus Thiodiazotropha lotti]MCG8019601.1 6-bladed beta-propeller [Candidatus Thiodiazotropha lotti]
MRSRPVSDYHSQHTDQKRVLLHLILLVSIIILVSGCASPGPSAQGQRADAGNYVWPAPPEKPRIRYLGSLKSSDSFDSGQGMGLREWFLGKEEEESRTLVKPYGVHSDSQGRVYVADTGISGLAVFDLNNESMEFLGTSGPGTLKKPTGVTTDSEGNVYVSDVIDHRVVMYSKDGQFINAFGGSDVLISPVGLTFNDSTQQLYVVDSKKHQVIVFNKNGGVDFTIGDRGSENGKFNYPTNITIDEKGQIYLADTMNFRVQIFDQQGKYLKGFGNLGDGRGQFSRLKGIGIDHDGHIYTIDAAFNNMQIFNQEGQLLLTVGKPGTGPGGFYLPAGAHVDKNNKIFVADQLNQRIQMFEYLGEAE